MLSKEQRRFLASRRAGHLATADTSGAPHVVPVCFAADDDTLYITIDQKPKGDPRRLKRLRNLLDNPAAAFVADRYDDDDWSRLGWVLLRARYPQYRAMDLAGLPVIAVRIERVASWGDLSVDS